MFTQLLSNTSKIIIAACVIFPTLVGNASTSLAREGGEGGEARNYRPICGAGKKRGCAKKVARKRGKKEQLVKPFTSRIKTPDGRKTKYKLTLKRGGKKAMLVEYGKNLRNGKWKPVSVKQVRQATIKKNSSYNSKTGRTTIKVRDSRGKTRSFSVKGNVIT